MKNQTFKYADFSLQELKKLQKIIAEELKDYRSIGLLLENKKELQAAGIPSVFPDLSTNNQEKEIKYRQIQRALNEGLTNEERKILEKKYLGKYQETDLSIYLDLGLKKGQYYAIKKRAIQQMAIALGII